MHPRSIAGAAIALIVAGCGSTGTLSETGATAAQGAGMTGRWMVHAPNAPMCGMSFAQSGDGGTVVPEGGCPAGFFRARRWALEQGGLAIKSEDGEPLAQLTASDGGFQGKSSAGIPITLTRYAPPTPR